MSWSEWLSLIALVLAGGALLLSLSTRRTAGEQAARRLLAPRSGPGAAATEPPLPPPPPAGDLVAFIANPTKPGASELREAAIKECTGRSMPEPLWLETTAEDPGVGQARHAIELGAVAVVAVGGDGTVRAVAEALAGTGVPMGLIPQGTGNLLARNLDLPLTDTPELLRLALTGAGRAIDVGWLRVIREAPDEPDDDTEPEDDAVSDDGPDSESTRSDDGAESDDGARSDDGTESDDGTVSGDSAPPAADAPAEPAREHIFLVIAGLGFDAAMVADTDEDLKARVGWIAYFVAGARHLHGRRPRLTIKIDDDPVVSRRVRSLLIGNCGRLPGGITLLPDAVLDDGWLDIAAIDTRGGLAGWAQLLGEVVLQGVGMRNDLRGKIGRIDHVRARRIHVVADRAEAVQVDGDVLGRALEIIARVDAGALIVRA
ncbi:diacylglycerol/lipid kinase family protein [Pengzhenrongella frigida]|uniref:Diacylglycerol kinase n=1 Tax=Pengzhenrongella frigida TaxID=1259133 RepID=A0A4Q5N4H7_9MICO|nr:diacylglycerol kinase family protein [Cellulomonas sp. HLT2-17]RYV51597.1 diacylglycerol kinase [Cellulomonas sp. HLT2-17]